MSANEPVGNVTTMYLESEFGSQEDYTRTNVSKGMIVNPAVTYAQLDTAMRALNGNLTRNTYHDTVLITEVSVTNKIAE